jgi:hypothetical protein
MPLCLRAPAAESTCSLFVSLSSSSFPDKSHFGVDYPFDVQNGHRPQVHSFAVSCCKLELSNGTSYCLVKTSCSCRWICDFLRVGPARLSEEICCLPKIELGAKPLFCCCSCCDCYKMMGFSLGRSILNEKFTCNR